MHDLIGNVELDDWLVQQGKEDRVNREEKGWHEVHWREGDASTDEDFGIRWRIDEAMCLLDKMATDCDVGFEQIYARLHTSTYFPTLDLGRITHLILVNIGKHDEARPGYLSDTHLPK